MDAQRSELAEAIPQHAGQIRTLSHAEATFLLTVLRVETLRAQSGYPATILAYFHNDGVASSPLGSCLGAIADYVNGAYRIHLNGQVGDHRLDPAVYTELKKVIVECCSPSNQVRSTAIRYMSTIVHHFRSILCNAAVITCLLEALTLLRRACEASYDDEVFLLSALNGEMLKF